MKTNNTGPRFTGGLARPIQAVEQHLVSSSGVATERQRSEAPSAEGAIVPARLSAIPVPVVAKSFAQLAIFVGDGTGSMQFLAPSGRPKWVEVAEGVRETISRLNTSRQRENFKCAYVTFDERGLVRMPPTPVKEVDLTQDFNPTIDLNGGTFLGAGMNEAFPLAKQSLAENLDLPASVVIVVLSDGRDREGTGEGPEESIRIADAIKRNPRITICTCYFATDGLIDPEAEETLRRIASDPVRGYRTVTDAATIREFFLASVSAGRIP